jgi:type IX secretion system PorP/SprF family membrane protein
VVKGQDPLFTQFNSNPLLLNPALAGTTYAPKFSLNHRSQWPSIEQAYTTYAISYDQFFKKYSSGIGVLVLTDNAGKGILLTNKIGLAYSYRSEIFKEVYFKGGLELAVIHNHLDWDKLIFFDQIDPILGISPGGVPLPTSEVRPESLNNLSLDAGAGVLVYSNAFYAGFSIKHLNAPDLTFLEGFENVKKGLDMRMTFLVGGKIPVSKNNFFSISPSVLLAKQGEFIQFNGGSFFNFHTISLGLFARHTFNNIDAAIASLSWKKDIFKFGYSFDYTLSNLTISTGGSHEISIVINLEDTKWFPKPYRYSDCLGLFR